MSHKYNYLNLILLLLGIFISSGVISQHVSIPDSIVVRNDEQNGLVFNYIVKPKNTVYSISKAFIADLIDLYAFNKDLNARPLGIGDTIIIPFDNSLLVDRINDNDRRKHIVFYKVGRKENLFRIAKIYFGVDVDVVKKYNSLPNSTIQPGQLLKIGGVAFMSLKMNRKAVIENSEDKIIINEPKDEIIVIDSIVENDDVDKLKFEKIVDSTKVFVKEQNDSISINVPVVIATDSGIAIWNKNNRTKGVFVLSNNARMNTLMEISNPLVNRKIFAKVIGKIPPNSYQDNVKIILSHQAATSLGALNTRFFVRIKYEK